MSPSYYLLLVVLTTLHVPTRLDQVHVDNAYKLSPSEKRAAHKAIVDRDFSRADSNKDGKLSQDEFPSRDSTTFNNTKNFFDDVVDKNGDGFVTLEEINSAKQKEEQRVLQEQWNSTLQSYDANKDYALQMEELEHTGALQAFGMGANSSLIMQRFDANHNGQIDLKEVNLREWYKTPFYEGNATQEKEKFNLYDKNKDSKLSFQEFNVPKYYNSYNSDDYNFNDYDENDDGFVSRKEYDAKMKVESTNFASTNVAIFDTNSDQKLQKNETTALLTAYRSPENATFNFTKFDTDHDGGLNATELVVLAENTKMNDLDYSGGERPTINIAAPVPRMF